MDSPLLSAEKRDILKDNLQVPREEVKHRHDILLAEIQQLRAWLGYRPIATRAHQEEMRMSANR